MQKRIAYVIAGAAVLCGAPLACAQVAVWRVAAAEHGPAAPPTGAGRTLTDITLGDVGADLVGLPIARRGMPNSLRPHERDALARYAQAGVGRHPATGRSIVDGFDP